MPLSYQSFNSYAQEGPDKQHVTELRLLYCRRSEPSQIVSALTFPVALVVLFGYVFGSAIAVPGGGNYREYLMPGLFVMSSAFAVILNALEIATEKSRGVTDRFRSMPMARLAVPFGQAGADLTVGAVSLLVMIGCGFAVGWRPHDGVLRAVAAFGLILLFRYALSWVGIFLGLSVKDYKTADNLAPLIFPFTMISNAFVPTAGMPAWLRALADWNPVSAAVGASRVLFGNAGASGASVGAAWPLQHPIVATLLWSALLIALFAPLAVRWYTRQD